MRGFLPVGKLLPQGRGHALPSQRVVETLDIALQFHLPNTTTNRLLQATTTQKTSAMEEGREGGKRQRQRQREGAINTSLYVQYRKQR